MFVKNYIYTLLLLIFFCYTQVQPVLAIDVTVTARVHGCGDNIVDNNEQCDGNPVSHNSCTNLGFSSGNLSCTNACNYDTASCSVNNQNTSPIYGFSITNFFSDIEEKRKKIADDILNLKLAKNSVIFEGNTKPETEVILYDGINVLAKTKSDATGKYSISVSNISSKNNIFTLTSNTERKTFIVNMYSNNIIKYNNVSLQSTVKSKIDFIVNEYEKRWNVDLTTYQTKI